MVNHAPEVGTGCGLSVETSLPGSKNRWLHPANVPLCTAILIFAQTTYSIDKLVLNNTVLSTNYS